METQTKKPRKRDSTETMIVQLLALLCFVGLPALVTTMAPVSWIKLQRTGDRVSARAKTCLFFFIPFRSVVIDPVTQVGRRTISGSVRLAERRKDRDVYRRSEDEGFLVIQGSDKSAEIPVTPFNLSSVIEKSESFLKNPQAAELKMFVVANWKFSVIAGGLASLLTLVYVIGVAAAVGRGLLRSLGLVSQAGAQRSTDANDRQ